ncbi:MAG: ABC transporter ATP-binding protein [Bdellovibrionota bacterium]
MSMEPVLEVKGLRKEFQSPGLGSPKLEILKGVDFSVAKGESVAILGRSGSGKSTLLGLLAGLDHPTSGSVQMEGNDLSQLSESELARFRGKNIGIVFQQFHLVNALTALDNIALPLDLTAGHSEALSFAERTERARGLLTRVGRSDRADQVPPRLSGGERQRIALARALIMRPKLVLADEPSGNLDAATGQIVIDLVLSQVKASGAALVLVTHDLALSHRCDRRYQLTDGRLQALQ